MRKYTGIQLREKSQEIIKRYDNSSVINTLNALIKEKGFSKQEFTLNESNSHIKGAVISDKNGKNIYIRSDLAESEKLFVFAHEVSHVLLHAGKDHMDFISKPRFESPERSDIETEANTLAYEFIFQLNKFIKLYKENSGDIESLAYCFNASIYRTKERIKFLEKQISLKKIDNFMTV